jgi:hypothetical protein
MDTDKHGQGDEVSMVQAISGATLWWLISFQGSILPIRVNPCPSVAKKEDFTFTFAYASTRTKNCS